jgi:hypothetical protein
MSEMPAHIEKKKKKKEKRVSRLVTACIMMYRE